MPQFYFDIIDEILPSGRMEIDCDDETEAKETAELAAKEMAIEVNDGPGKRDIVVFDQAGSEIHRVTVK